MPVKNVIQKIVNSLGYEIRRLPTLADYPVDKPYFPNLPADAMQFQNRLRHGLEHLSNQDRMALSALFSEAHPEFVKSSFEEDGEFVVVSQLDQHIAFSNPIPNIIFSHILSGYEEWLKRKYSLPGFVEIEDGDVVVDCGSFVGGFTLSAAKTAAQVHAFEPAKKNFESLCRNSSGFENVTCNQAGLFNATGTGEINVSHSAVEHSLLTPDDGEVVETQRIELTRLDDYFAALGITQIDFVKVEAEGVEIEVVEGLGNIRPRKFAIDVSPERDNQSPAKHFEELLAKWGYHVEIRSHVLFAKL